MYVEQIQKYSTSIDGTIDIVNRLIMEHNNLESNLITMQMKIQELEKTIQELQNPNSPDPRRIKVRHPS